MVVFRISEKVRVGFLYGKVSWRFIGCIFICICGLWNRVLWESVGFFFGFRGENEEDSWVFGYSFVGIGK